MSQTKAQIELAHRVVSICLDSSDPSFDACQREVAEQIASREQDTLEVYQGKDGHRQWAHQASVWLYPGDRIITVNDETLSP